MTRKSGIFSVLDVVEVLTDSANPTDYFKKMRKRDPELAEYVGTNCLHVEMMTPTGKKRKAIWYSFWTGITEPIGAIIGLGLLHWFLPVAFIGFLLIAVVGIMIYISFDTLLPLSHEYGDWHYAITGIMSGIIVIWASILLLNGY